MVRFVESVNNILQLLVETFIHSEALKELFWQGYTTLLAGAELDHALQL